MNTELTKFYGELWTSLPDGGCEKLMNKWPPEEREAIFHYKTFGREFDYIERIKVITQEDTVDSREWETKDRIRENVANLAVFLNHNCIFNNVDIVYKDKEYKVKLHKWSSGVNLIIDSTIYYKVKWKYKRIASWQCQYNWPNVERGKNWRPFSIVGVVIEDASIPKIQQLIDRLVADQNTKINLNSDVAKEEFYKLMDL